MPDTTSRYANILARIREAADAAGRAPPQLLAVSKAKPASAIRELAALGQRAFGENYLQEALDKQQELSDLRLEWHFIGHLQSRKCTEVAAHFDWLQSLDRDKLIPRLDEARDPARGPLNVLLQVNIDGEASKSGCTPGNVDALASAVAACANLRLRGLMAIPAPGDDARLRDSFARLRRQFESLQTVHPDVDTLSMGMSDDFPLAIAEGSSMLRIGSALFGPRH
ncbi:MAG: YggS family pyridoxal phosphate-dependent enzyme [Lysobacteraceae bacterium]